MLKAQLKPRGGWVGMLKAHKPGRMGRHVEGYKPGRMGWHIED